MYTHKNLQQKLTHKNVYTQKSTSIKILINILTEIHGPISVSIIQWVVVHHIVPVQAC